MFIKTLILKGFKGFREKTVLDFEAGIGAIVGPNGCGKSNIIDALKWVWGEQKLSDLRSEKIEDLIFNGSKGEEPINFCEVEVVLNNQAKIFPINFEEVSILRRVYRSGESESYINKQKCRLKDIYELLSNTGIGKSNYSVIEQGKIERIFSNKVEDRRKIFEETAGLGEYEIKKKEYEFKIKKTNDNIIRLNDILKIKNKQLDQLSFQAQKSKKYFKLEEEQKLKQNQLLQHELYLIEIKINENKKNYEKLKLEKKELIEKNQAKKKTLLAVKDSLTKKDYQNNQQHRKIISLEQKVNSLKYEVNYLEDNLKELNQDFFDQKKHTLKYQDEKKLILIKIKENKKTILIIEKNLLAAQKKILDLKEKQKQIENQNKKINLNLNTLREKQKSSELKKQNIIEKEKEVNARLLDEIGEIKKKLEKKNYIKKINLLNEKLAEMAQILKKEKAENITDKFFEFKSILGDYFFSENLLYNFFFSSTGTYAEKNQLENQAKFLNEQLRELEQEINILKEELENNKIKSLNLIKEINTQQIERVKREENFKEINYKNEIKKEQLKNIESFHRSLLENKAKLLDKKNLFLQEKKKKSTEINTTEKEIIKLKELEKKLQQELYLEKNKKNTLEQAIINDEKQIEIYKIKLQKNSLEEKIALKEKNNLKEKILEESNREANKIIPQFLKNFSQTKAKIGRLKEVMRAMGKVNLLAVTEYDELKEEIINLEKEKKDVEKSIINLDTISSKLQNETIKIFIKTLEKTSVNFDLIIKRLFNGGQGRIRLKDKKKPLISDIDILVEPEGKKYQKISLFSGGEKSLISLAVLFALFLNNPSPVCLLDEVDAALDYSNIERLLNIFNEMKKKSQLILISHNSKTMDIIDYMYGISMQNGISKSLSLKVNKPINQ